MRVFVTGATGFVGSAVVKELLQAGHHVLGLARSEKSADALTSLGAEVQRGDVNDFEILKAAASAFDAVIHTAFNHDFSKYKESCESDRLVIQTLGEALRGTEKPLVVTSGIGLVPLTRMVTEHDATPSSDVIPRAATEEAAKAAADAGTNVYIVRLPPTTHGKGDHGFVPMIIDMAKANRESAYIGEGNNHWPAVHRLDAAVIYRLAIEQRPEQKIFHAVAESGVAFREIAQAIGNGLHIPVISKNTTEAEKHFTWFMYFASIDCKASSALTREVLGWTPTHAELIADIKADYF